MAIGPINTQEWHAYLSLKSDWVRLTPFVILLWEDRYTSFSVTFPALKKASSHLFTWIAWSNCSKVPNGLKCQRVRVQHIGHSGIWTHNPLDYESLALSTAPHALDWIITDWVCTCITCLLLPWDLKRNLQRNFSVEFILIIGHSGHRWHFLNRWKYRTGMECEH